MQHLSRQLTKGIVMKTVGEFKKVGLVFVNGDVYCHKGSTLKMLADGITLKWFERDAKALNATIMGFAWRENTGVKPEFGGLVEWVGDSGAVYVNRPDELIWSDKCIAKWRPSLNQPSLSVESDTKESAIHKAWVALKGDLKNVRGLEGDDNVVVICLSKVGVFNAGDYSTSEWYVGGSNKHWKVICTIKEFTDYCEKMAAEEKRMDKNGNDGLHHDIHGIVSDEFPDNGFVPRCVFVPITSLKTRVNDMKVSDKPIFTQAMADAGELPPVGSKVLFDGDSCFEFHSEYEQGLVDGGVVEIISHFDSGAGNVAAFLFDCNYGRSVSYGNNTCFKPIDTLTDREKAINEMASLISLRTRDGAKEVCGELYDAGYRKC